MRLRAATSLWAMLLAMCANTASGNYAFDAPDYLTSAAAWPAWAENLERHSGERSAIEQCVVEESACSGKLKSLREVLIRGAGLEPDRQLRLVNQYINKRHYKRDRRALSPSVVAGGEAELRNHWSTLLEFLQRGGDCEDYAVAKYFLLREFGFSPDDMRVVVTYDRAARAYHAVLAVRREDGRSWLLELDNTIVKGSHRNYRFIYALNENGIWDHAR